MPADRRLGIWHDLDEVEADGWWGRKALEARRAIPRTGLLGASILTVLTIPLTELREGLNFLRDEQLIINRLDDRCRVFEDRCMHRGGR